MKAKAFPDGYNGDWAISEEEVIAHNTQHGQPTDIWAFAIVVLTILKNADVQPLKVIADALNRSEKHLHFKDFDIQFLKQDEIAAEIEYWRSRASPTVQALLDVAERMLQVDSDQRINIDEILEQINQI